MSENEDGRRGLRGALGWSVAELKEGDALATDYQRSSNRG